MEEKTQITLAFLLALSDIKISLTHEEKETLGNIADQLDIQTKAWETHTKPMLLEIIDSNIQLKEAYETYHSQLEKNPNLTTDILPTSEELKQEFNSEPVFAIKGSKPTDKPTGYEQQINNTMILISRSPEPETTINQLSFIGKLKQFLTGSSQS
ncbi:MAG: hypothetical protein QNJ37_19530 [Crocosphaera sp.]|nr:hypothetical protein [Crocosphaera sp.]MDJ0728473.1 hypothetical protein [Crocosphaera sp.]